MAVDPQNVAVLKDFLSQSLIETRKMFLSNYGVAPPIHEPSNALKLRVKISEEYGQVEHMAPPPVPKKEKK